MTMLGEVISRPNDNMMAMMAMKLMRRIAMIRSRDYGTTTYYSSYSISPQMQSRLRMYAASTTSSVLLAGF